MTTTPVAYATVVRVALAIEASLIRQASCQPGTTYTPADECGVADACLSIVITELAEAAVRALQPDA